MNKLKAIVLIRQGRIEEAGQAIDRAQEIGRVAVSNPESPGSSFLDLVTHPVSPQSSPHASASKGPSTGRPPAELRHLHRKLKQSSTLKEVEEYVRTYSSDQTFLVSTNQPLVSNHLKKLGPQVSEPPPKIAGRTGFVPGDKLNPEVPSVDTSSVAAPLDRQASFDMDQDYLLIAPRVRLEKVIGLVDGPTTHEEEREKRRRQAAETYLMEGVAHTQQIEQNVTLKMSKFIEDQALKAALGGEDRYASLYGVKSQSTHQGKQYFSAQLHDEVRANLTKL